MAEASGAEVTLGVGAASLEAVEKGLEKGFDIGSLNRATSLEHPDNQIPTRPVTAKRTAFRRTAILALELIGLTTPTQPYTGSL